MIPQKLLTRHVIPDFMRFDAHGLMAEHWGGMQVHPEPVYAPMRRSSDDFSRFRALFGIREGHAIGSGSPWRAVLYNPR